MAEQLEIEGFSGAKEEYTNMRNEKIKKLTAKAYQEVEKLELAKADFKLIMSAAFEAEEVEK